MFVQHLRPVELSQPRVMWS